MGKIVRTEKGAKDRFQFTLWDNGNGDFIIEIRKFFIKIVDKKAVVNYKMFDRIRFSPGEFERFKTWIKNFKKK